MAIKLTVQKNFQVIIPLRFARAVANLPLIDVPDLDDRGYAMPRPVGLNASSARGAMFGITLGDTVRVKVVREDIDISAALFATVSSSAAPQIEIVEPIAGQPITASGIIKVRAIADTGAGQTLEIRFGSPTGPIIAEAEPHVFSIRTLNVTPHVCTIHQVAAGVGTGVAPTVNGTPLDVNRIFNLVRAIWRPAGVELNVGAVQAETFSGFSRDDFAPRGGGAGQEGAVVARNNLPGTCNIYFIRFMDTSLGVGINRDTMATEGWTRPGIIVAIEGQLDPATGGISRRVGPVNSIFQELGNDTAHEIGHFLSLAHADQANSPGPPDSYCRRQLMHPNNLLPQAVVPLKNAANNDDIRFNDIGYGVGGGGAGHRGCLVTIKDYATHRSDGETTRARNRFKSPNLF